MKHFHLSERRILVQDLSLQTFYLSLENKRKICCIIQTLMMRWKKKKKRLDSIKKIPKYNFKLVFRKPPRRLFYMNGNKTNIKNLKEIFSQISWSYLQGNLC